jgi:hypothetical protein
MITYLYIHDYVCVCARARENCGEEHSLIPDFATWRNVILHQIAKHAIWQHKNI